MFFRGDGEGSFSLGRIPAMRRIVSILAVFFLADPFTPLTKNRNPTSPSRLTKDRGEATRGASEQVPTAACPLFSQRPTACSAAGLTAGSPTLFRQGALLSYLTHRVTATERAREIRSWPPIPRRTTSACLTPITASWFFQGATSNEGRLMLILMHLLFIGFTAVVFLATDLNFR